MNNISNLIQQIQHEDTDIRDNAASKLVSLGSSTFPELLPLLQAESWNIRYRVADVIGKIGIHSTDVQQIFESALEKETDDYVKEKMEYALSNCVLEKLCESPIANKDLQEIPSFSTEEAEDIKKILQDRNIPYQEKIVCYGHPKFSYREEHSFCVTEDNFSQAIEEISSYLGLKDESVFSGECPACGTTLEKVERCTECELFLAIDPVSNLMHHPFLGFLYHNGLLEA